MFAPIAGLEASMTRLSVFVTLTCAALLFSQLLAAVALAAPLTPEFPLYHYQNNS
jgi:hypothetical protein